MNSLRIDPLALEGAALVTSNPCRDERGTFARLFCETELRSILGERRIVSVNFSQTNMVGAVRGLHFQYRPHGETKLVRCLAGRVFDVIVDIRTGSSTFLHWTNVVLEPDKFQMVVIPEGCAHGFQVLESPASLLYLHTAPHAPEAEGELCPIYPRLSINWPLQIAQMSVRDQYFPHLTDDFYGVAQ